jgi:alkaline phosphatase
LFNNGHIDGALDRRVLKKGTVSRYPDQPDLVDQTKAALRILSRNDNGFFLMVESGRIDKYGHSLDWERSVYDTIMLDNAVQVARDFTAKANDTLIIVVPDHAHGAAIIGTYDDDRPGTQLREKLGIYSAAGFPTYGTPDSDGYPASVEVKRRLAFVFSGLPDHCATGKPSLEGPFVPSSQGPDGKSFVVNEANCKPGAARIVGNLPFSVNQGIHAGDDVIATAMGPGSELVRGHMPNVGLFRVMATALGLGR